MDLNQYVDKGVSNSTPTHSGGISDRSVVYDCGKFDFPFKYYYLIYYLLRLLLTLTMFYVYITLNFYYVQDNVLICLEIILNCLKNY